MLGLTFLRLDAYHEVKDMHSAVNTIRQHNDPESLRDAFASLTHSGHPIRRIRAFHKLLRKAPVDAKVELSSKPISQNDKSQLQTNFSALNGKTFSSGMGKSRIFSQDQLLAKTFSPMSLVKDRLGPQILKCRIQNISLKEDL